MYHPDGCDARSHLGSVYSLDGVGVSDLFWIQRQAQQGTKPCTSKEVELLEGSFLTGMPDNSFGISHWNYSVLLRDVLQSEFFLYQLSKITCTLAASKRTLFLIIGIISKKSTETFY